MANGQISNPKEVLRGGLSVPRSLEASLPQGAPQISTLLSNALDTLPDIPAMPASFPALPTGANGVTDFIKGVEAVLPKGVPLLSQAGSSRTVIGTVLAPPSNATALLTKIGL